MAYDQNQAILRAITNPAFNWSGILHNTAMPKLIQSYQPQMPQQSAPQPAMPQADPQALQAQYSRLASQASNALNGGLLGYQPSEIRAAGSNPQTFTGPTGSFRFPFGLLNGQGG